MTIHSTRLDNDLACLLSHKIADKYKKFLHSSVNREGRQNRNHVAQCINLYGHMTISFIGGYPVIAGTPSNIYKNAEISKRTHILKDNASHGRKYIT